MDADKIIEGLEKKYGTTIVHLNGESHMSGVDVIPTKLAPLDIATGIGGIPRGYFTEVYSPEGVGKTTLCLHVIARAQEMGLGTAFIDMEHRLDPIWASTIGVDLSKLYVTQPPFGEAALNIARHLISDANIKLVVIDSIPALVPKKELEGEVGDQFVGLQARMIAQNFRQTTPSLKANGAAIVFTNQMRTKFSGGSLVYGPQQTTSGGWAVRYYASMRLDLRRVKSISNQAGDIVGQDVLISIKKTSLSVPYRTALVRLTFNKGFDMEESIINSAIDLGMIERAGSWYTINEDKIQGRVALASHLREAGLTDQLYEQVMETYSPQVLEEDVTEN